MLERLKRIFHRRSRRRKERELDNQQDAPRQDSPIHKKESHRSEHDAHHPVQKTQSTVLGTRSTQTKREAEFTGPRYSRDAGVSGGTTGGGGLPIIRPMSHEPGPRSNIHQLNQYEMPNRGLNPPLHRDGSVSPGSPPTRGPEFVDEAGPALLKPNKPQERGQEFIDKAEPASLEPNQPRKRGPEIVNEATPASLEPEFANEAGPSSLERNKRQEREPEFANEAGPSSLEPNQLEEQGPSTGFEPGSESPVVDVDYTFDTRKPVTHETIRPHVHTIYEPRRTRSIHYEDHYYYIQPIIDTSVDSPRIQPAAGAGQSNLVGTE